ncbi:hypothetical protein CEXT_491611 [Caerostris extrusa]|uniref:Uncharacterized protein n=1 Tax=Caerostris extrusa TaxID=172846 RepID=A0AAV4U2Y8_CAEEX|nr:hypothetical protein CEXT_491611 [Caerostris extrusa]
MIRLHEKSQNCSVVLMFEKHAGQSVVVKEIVHQPDLDPAFQSSNIFDAVSVTVIPPRLRMSLAQTLYLALNPISFAFWRTLINKQENPARLSDHISWPGEKYKPDRNLRCLFRCLAAATVMSSPSCSFGFANAYFRNTLKRKHFSMIGSLKPPPPLIHPLE